jgi:predicted O-methyltransferase YrrM
MSSADRDITPPGRSTRRRIAEYLPLVNSLIQDRDRLLSALSDSQKRLGEAEAQCGELSRRLAGLSDELNYAGERHAELDRLFHEASNDRAALMEYRSWVPPGHFYSPVPGLEEVQRNHSRVYTIAEAVPGVDLREAEQLSLLAELATYYADLPFVPGKQPGLLYFFENPGYSYSDAIFLHCMIRHARPKRVFEVGSGYSSCVTLDTNSVFFDGSIQCTFIEPYLDTLRSLTKEDDLKNERIVEERLQDVDARIFEELQTNDILFIDSTHVSRFGSDVNYLFFEVLPRLRPGVYVHFHDIFFPFEYPAPWVWEGRAWTEAYLLRAFLMFNRDFEIVIWNDFLAKRHWSRLEASMPLCTRNTGASIWLRRTD